MIYQAPSGAIELRGDFKRENVWATQAQIADIFDIERSVATKHIRNILKDKEIDEKSNVQKMHIAHSDKPVALYSLDVVLSVGERRKRGTKTNPSSSPSTSSGHYPEGQQIAYGAGGARKLGVEKFSAAQDYKTQLLAQRAKLKELFDSALHKSFIN